LSPKAHPDRRAYTTMPDFIPAMREGDPETIHGFVERPKVRGASAPLPNVVSTTTPADTGTPHRQAGRLATIKDALLRHSFDLGAPMVVANEAHDIFIEHAELPGDRHSHDLAEVKLEHDRFGRIFCKLADAGYLDKLPRRSVAGRFANS